MSDWTCEGQVRGSCGIRHRTLEAAVRCCERDMRHCQGLGGYSDRTPWRQGEGETLESLVADLTEVHPGAMVDEEYQDGGRTYRIYSALCIVRDEETSWVTRREDLRRGLDWVLPRLGNLAEPYQTLCHMVPILEGHPGNTNVWR